MQFEPATFGAYATVGPDGARPASPYDPVDAVYTAASMLCANGAGSAQSLYASVLDYNHSAAYVDTVLTLSLAIGEDPATSGTVVAALTFAAQHLGTPYRWGGTGNGGFDCSGLAQAAYRQAGITLPRVAQDQFDAGPPVPGSATVQPGDLLFFGSGPTGVDHVGIYVGAGEMIDAPHTGALVRFDDAGWSGLVGATRPA
jgi:cell wall-associated NlpC family hydrolase